MKLRRYSVWCVTDTVPPTTGHVQCVARCFTKRGAEHLYRWYVIHDFQHHFWVSGPS